MNYKNLIVLMIMFSLLFSINAISASENNLTCEKYTEPILNQSTNAADNLLENSQNDDVESEESSNRNVSDEEYIIYVGKNTTSDGGNGSYENPFATLKLACANVSDGKNKVTLNIFEGSYVLDSHLKFNTSNLKIQGMGNVVIKSLNITDADLNWATIFSNPLITGISLTGPLVNFTYSNLIFDGSGWGLDDNSPGLHVFFPFYQYKSRVNIGVFNNCTFNMYKASPIFDNSENIKLIKCKVNNGYITSVLNGMQFEYCTLLGGLTSGVIVTTKNNSFDSIWFGQNEIPSYMFPAHGYAVNSGGSWVDGYVVPLTRYAIFSVSENYIDDNTYEIIGKLMWNDSTTDGIENLGDMIVQLSSMTGNISETAILKNGTFRVIYNTNSTEHKITAKLNKAIINLEFNNTNMLLNPLSVYYGEEQKITGNFSQVLNGTVSIVVYNDKYNKTYNLTVNNSSSFAYIIPDILKEGIYTVNVTLNGMGVHGFNTTTLTVSKISDYVFNTIIPSSVVVGENAVISIELPEDVMGTVTIKFGNETRVLDANQTLVVSFSNLNATNYPVNISYSGSDKYTSNEKIDNVNVEKSTSSISAEDMEFIYGQNIVIPVNTVNATGVSVRVLKDGVEVLKTIGNPSEVVINTLDSGKYIVELTTLVNGNYIQTSENINLTIKKADALVDVGSEFVGLANDYYAGERGAIFYAILKDVNGNPIANKIVQIVINNVIYNIKTDNNGKASIQINLANANKYICIISFSGDNNYNAAPVKFSKITLNKKTTTIKATNKIFKVKTKTKKITVTLNTVKNPIDGKTYLKAGKKITLTIKGKTYKAKINKRGTATFKIQLNKKGQYTAKIKFKGDKTYKESNKTIKINVK